MFYENQKQKLPTAVLKILKKFIAEDRKVLEEKNSHPIGFVRTSILFYVFPTVKKSIKETFKFPHTNEERRKLAY